MSEHVAEFKVPRRIVELEELPKGPTGKVQRIGMAERLGLTSTEESGSGSKSDVPFSFQDRNGEPISLLGATVASIFAKVLKREQVGFHENFFELGGDSIRATQITNRLQALLPLDLNAVLIFPPPRLIISFRTGDEGYLDAEGYLFLTGRLKEMINRGGEKIAPREVEEVLLGHQAIAQAAVFGMPHPTFALRSLR